MGFLTGATGSTALLQNISLGTQVMGGITSATGAYYGAQGQRATLGAQAAIGEANARISELGAQAALRDGQQSIATATAKYGQLAGAQRAAMAANGVALGEGSAADVAASTEFLKEQDKTTLEINAMRAAFGQRQQAANQTSQANMARANAAGLSAGGAAFTSLLGSATKVASTWYQFSKDSGTDSAFTRANAVGASGGDALGTLINLKGWDK